MKLIQLLFDIKMRTLGFAFCQPQKKSLPKSLTPKKSLQNFKPKKSPQIVNSNPKKGFAHPITYIPEYPRWVSYSGTQQNEPHQSLTPDP